MNRKQREIKRKRANQHRLTAKYPNYQAEQQLKRVEHWKAECEKQKQLLAQIDSDLKQGDKITRWYFSGVAAVFILAILANFAGWFL